MNMMKTEKITGKMTQFGTGFAGKKGCCVIMV